MFIITTWNDDGQQQPGFGRCWPFRQVRKVWPDPTHFPDFIYSWYLAQTCCSFGVGGLYIYFYYRQHQQQQQQQLNKFLAQQVNLGGSLSNFYCRLLFLLGIFFRRLLSALDGCICHRNKKKYGKKRTSRIRDEGVAVAIVFSYSRIAICIAAMIISTATVYLTFVVDGENKGKSWCYIEQRFDIFCIIILNIFFDVLFFVVCVPSAGKCCQLVWAARETTFVAIVLYIFSRVWNISRGGKAKAATSTFWHLAEVCAWPY